jgi:hypothetical protein
LNEDPAYPTSREALILSHGWKVFDLTMDKRVHAAEHLKMLTSQSYGTARDVIISLKRYFWSPFHARVFFNYVVSQ